MIKYVHKYGMGYETMQLVGNERLGTSNYSNERTENKQRSS